MTVQEAMDALAQFGYRECTEKSNQQNGEHFQSLYAFEGPDGDGLYYYCDTEDEVFALLKLVCEGS